MAIIGSYAGIIFEINDKKKLTFTQFTRSVSPRWDTHDVLQSKPLPEFQGPGLDDISFDIKLRADWGINPEEAMSKLREFATKGHTSAFIKGNKPISQNHWVIKKVTEEHRTIDNKGNVLSMDVSLSLLEYPKIELPNAKITVKTNTPSSSSSNSSKKAIGEMTITVKSVHIRSGPGVNNKILGYAFMNNVLPVYGISDGWYSLGGGKYITANSAYSKFKKG